MLSASCMPGALGAARATCCLPASSGPLRVDVGTVGLALWGWRRGAGWLPASPRLQEVFGGGRAVLWQWPCCPARLLAGLCKPAWSSLDGEERVLSGWAEWETSAAGKCPC